jgi:hypothetical protein
MMKTYNKISIILMGALLWALTSCTEEVLRDASPVQEGGIQAYIPETNSASHLFLPDDATTFTVTIGRQNTQGRAEVSLSVTEEKRLLVLDNTVVFEDGETFAELEVDFSAMNLGQSTTLELAINEADRYLYGLEKFSITVLRDYKWVDVGSVEFQDLFWTESTAKVPIQQAEGEDLFRLKDVYSEVFLALDPTDPDIKKCRGYHLQFYLDTTYTDATEKYRFCNAQKLPTGVQDLGIGMYGYTFYWALPGELNGGYCSFTNYGNEYQIDGVCYLNGAPKYYYTFKFTWTDGFPGIIPDPYKGEDIVIGNLERTMDSAEAYYLGYRSYDVKDMFENDSTIYVDNYRVVLKSDDVTISLDVLAFDGSADQIPAGTYTINNSNDGNSVRPGNYSEANDGLSSYVKLALDLDLTLYLASGTVEIAYNVDEYTFTIDAVTVKGSVIKATYTGPLSITDSPIPGSVPGGAKAKIKAVSKAVKGQGPQNAKLSLIK